MILVNFKTFESIKNTKEEAFLLKCRVKLGEGIY